MLLKKCVSHFLLVCLISRAHDPIPSHVVLPHPTPPNPTTNPTTNPTQHNQTQSNPNPNPPIPNPYPNPPLPLRPQVIRDGCKACPANEDVWLEAARLQTRENAKSVLAEAVKKIPQSVKIWVQAGIL